MNRVYAVAAFVAALALLVAAFAIPMFGYDDAEVPPDVAEQLKHDAGHMVDYNSMLFTQIREATWGGPEGTTGVVSYRTIFGVEVNRIAVAGQSQESLTQRGWGALWLWIAFVGAEIGLVSLGIWQLTTTPPDRTQAVNSDDTVVEAP